MDLFLIEEGEPVSNVHHLPRCPSGRRGDPINHVVVVVEEAAEVVEEEAVAAFKEAGIKVIILLGDRSKSLVGAVEDEIEEESKNK